MQNNMFRFINSRTLLFLLGTFTIILWAGVLVSSVSAGTSQNTRGFAWGGGATTNGPGYDGIGWISFNNLSDGSAIDYGVNIPNTDGPLSGYAWSEYYGWLSFNGSDLTGCSPSLSQATRTGNVITGGARFLAIRDASSNSGGWSGCVSLSGGSPAYGVIISGTTLSGYAWSDELGWISFGPGGTSTGVTIIAAPPSTPTNLTATANATCGSGRIDLSWNAVTGATSYTLKDGTTEIAVGNVTTYNHTGLSAGSSHTYSIRANNGAGSSLYSGTVSATVAPACAIADLISQNLTLSAGPYTQGTPITLMAQVRNGGTAGTGASFSDNFTYQWNSTSGTWLAFTGNTIAEPLLASGATANDTTTFTPAQTGTLYIQHCVDSTNVISEGANETPNCTKSAGVTVNLKPTGTITATPNTLNGGGTSTIAWSSSNATACTVASLEVANTDTWSGTSNLGVITTPLYGNTTYTLVCDGILIMAAPITVNSTPELTASNRIVEAGSTVTLTWNTHNGDETSCTLSGGGNTNIINTTTGDTSTGSATVTVTAYTTYTLTCPGGTDTVTIEIVPIGYET